MRRTLMIVAAAGLVPRGRARDVRHRRERVDHRCAAPTGCSRTASRLGTPLDGVAVNAVFAAKRVSGTSGCNGYTSSYTTNGSRMTITNDGVSTLIACEGAAGKVEPKYLAALARVGRWRITGTTLTLSTRTGRRLLVYRASVGADALRGSWEVTSLYTGDAISSPVPGSALDVEVRRRHRVG